MKKVYIVRAYYDEEAAVWCATGENFLGLATEAATVDELLKKIPPMLDDLLDCGMDSGGNDFPVRFLVDSPAIAHRGCAQ